MGEIMVDQNPVKEEKYVKKEFKDNGLSDVAASPAETVRQVPRGTVPKSEGFIRPRRYYAKEDKVQKQVEQMYASKDFTENKVKKEVEKVDAKDTVKESKTSSKVQNGSRQKTSVMDKNISISFRTAFFVVVLALLLSTAFAAGRYVFPSDGTDPIAAAVVGFWEKSQTSVVEETEDTEVEVTEAAPPEEMTEPAETSEPVAAEDSTAVEETEDNVPESTTVITEYGDVELSFTRTPAFTWHADAGWGQIETIYYTIKNNENGIIKPAKFHIIIEGYEGNDLVRKVAVPHNTVEIGAGKTVQNAVDRLISYSETVTEPANIEIKLVLVDEQGVTIAEAAKEFNLKE